MRHPVEPKDTLSQLKEPKPNIRIRDNVLNSSILDDIHYRLDLPSDKLPHFDAIVADLQNLSSNSILTLRVELFNLIFYHISLGLAEGNYMIENDDFAPETHIMDLAKELTQFALCIEEAVSADDQRFLMLGLTNLVDTAFVKGAQQIKSFNDIGYRKMCLNIATMEQSLKELVPDANDAVLAKSRQYYELFKRGPKGLLTAIKENAERLPFDYDEYKTLLTLQYSASLQQHNATGRRESALQVRREYNEQVIELNEYLWTQD